MANGLHDYLKTHIEYRDSNKKARLSYLYSDISQARTNNPTGFTSTVSWFSNLIGDITSKGLQNGGGELADSSEKLVWHLDRDFVERLRWASAGTPSGLGTVAVSMRNVLL